ncbi:MAG TPA: DUF1552 domain-containing protein [Polyangiaceae bacterium]
MKFLNRRRFLQGAAGVAVGLPFLESVRPRSLQAQEGQPTTRFLSFHCSSGVETERFWPSFGRLTPESFAGRGSEPLAPYADRILIPRGVHGYPVGTWTGHLEGTQQALTAAAVGNSGPAAASIDQLIAKALNPPGREALVLRPGGRDLGVTTFNSISYRGPGDMVDAESNPWLAYRAIMGSAAPGTGDDDPMVDAVLRKRQSVIDLVRTEFSSLQAMDLSGADREKLEAHFQLIRDVEGTITDPTGPVMCALDEPSAAALQGIESSSVEANENFPAMARLHARVAVLSLACGYTRSAVLQWGAAVAGSPMYQWDGIQHNYRHHPLSHGTTDDFNETAVNGYKNMLFEIDRWNMSEFKKMLDLLDGYVEAEGRTLLDNSVVFWSNEFSHGQGHTTGDLPLVIVGGAGYFKLGESLVIQGSQADIGGVSGRGGSSNKLLATILNAVGAPMDGFSDGPTDELGELKA